MPPTRFLFVTGTDTGVGKTVVAVALLRSLAAAGYRAAGMKPVSAGIDGALGVNGDVAALRSAASVEAPLAEINPCAFTAPIAPHVAALREGRRIDLAVVRSAAAALARRAEVVVAEGAGGAMVPIDAHLDMLDIADALDAPVILVVGIRLGCLNHALLSEAAIRQRGLPLAGWVATRIDAAMPAADASVAALAERLRAPFLDDIAEPHAATLSAHALRLLGFAPRS